MSDETIRVFVGTRGLDVPRGASALDAVRSADRTLAEAVAAGTRRITDSRGLPVDPSAPAFAGAIFRVVGARTRAGD